MNKFTEAYFASKGTVANSELYQLLKAINKKKNELTGATKNAFSSSIEKALQERNLINLSYGVIMMSQNYEGELLPASEFSQEYYFSLYEKMTGVRLGKK